MFDVVPSQLEFTVNQESIVIKVCDCSNVELSAFIVIFLMNRSLLCLHHSLKRQRIIFASLY